MRMWFLTSSITVGSHLTLFIDPQRGSRGWVDYGGLNTLGWYKLEDTIDGRHYTLT